CSASGQGSARQQGSALPLRVGAGVPGSLPGFAARRRRKARASWPWPPQQRRPQGSHSLPQGTLLACGGIEPPRQPGEELANQEAYHIVEYALADTGDAAADISPVAVGQQSLPVPRRRKLHECLARAMAELSFRLAGNAQRLRFVLVGEPDRCMIDGAHAGNG